MTPKPKGRGGKRPGSGRPRTLDEGIAVGVKLEREQFLWVRDQAAARGVSKSEFVRGLIQSARNP